MFHELLFAICFLAMIAAPGYVLGSSNRDKRDSLWCSGTGWQPQPSHAVYRRRTGSRTTLRGWRLTSAGLRWRTRQATGRSPSSWCSRRLAARRPKEI